MARPPSGKEETILVSVRFEPYLLKELDELVEATNSKRATWLKKFILKGLNEEKERPEIKAMIKAHRLRNGKEILIKKSKMYSG